LDLIIVVYCEHLSDDGNAEWNETLSNGTIANGKCLDGFQGSVSRKCLQSGIWGSISGTCNGIPFFFIVYLFTYLFFSINNIQ